MNQKINISEIFYSLQGEGIRTGEPSIFIRTQGCKTKHACAMMGIKCDTEYESGKEWNVEDLAVHIGNKFQVCKTIVWTGGEPTDQLTIEMVEYFKELGYYQCIETSGLNPTPKGIDFVTLSPKVAEHILEKNFQNGVSEIKYVRHEGQQIPKPSVVAHHYFISPHSDGFTINTANVKHCIQLCLENPQWKLSIQSHKLWKVL